MVDLPNIKPFLKRFDELELKIANPDLFKDATGASIISREHSRIKNIIELHQKIGTAMTDIQQSTELLNDPEFAETAREEIDLLNKNIDALHNDLLLAMLPADPDIGRNTIIEIRAGAGGGEASLFAADLYRMYCKLAENKGWRNECLSQSASETGGFKEIIFLIKGDDVWSKLKFESGVHRVQRVPVTEANGRIHTSTATVAVLPEARDVEIKIDPSELEINVCRASGPGGQGVNTTDSAVQILHKPTGMTVYCADERSQLKNKNKVCKLNRKRKRINTHKTEKTKLERETEVKELELTISPKVELQITE